MPSIDPLSGASGIAPRIADEEFELDRLPREHPRWVKDALAISQRARVLLTRLKPLAVRVLTFWDHHVRGLRVGNRSLSVDGSGSYRLE